MGAACLAYEYLQALSATGCQEMGPVLLLLRAKGDAMTDINRADSANDGLGLIPIDFVAAHGRAASRCVGMPL